MPISSSNKNMKKVNGSILFLAALLITIFGTSGCDQTTTNVLDTETVKDTVLKYKDFIGENPNAEADMKVVSDFVNACVNEDTIKAKSLLDANYLGFGPSINDSATALEEINAWKENYKIHSARKVSFITQTYRVLVGDRKGDWVSLMGDYSCTLNEKKMKMPFQLTARLLNGKIVGAITYWDKKYLSETLGYNLL
ncbi:MAG: hypothetical protein CK539_02125 [Flavobacteriales bacterium]|nr:MAG: hypothetical protein CK539_02125 [Flavobacteriales bacterium]